MSFISQFLHNFSNQFLKNLKLIKFKRIEANYLWAYKITKTFNFFFL